MRFQGATHSTRKRPGATREASTRQRGAEPSSSATAAGIIASQLPWEVRAEQVGVALDRIGGVDNDLAEMPALRRAGDERGQRLKLDPGPVLDDVHHSPIVVSALLEVLRRSRHGLHCEMDPHRRGGGGDAGDRHEGVRPGVGLGTRGREPVNDGVAGEPGNGSPASPRLAPTSSCLRPSACISATL